MSHRAASIPASLFAVDVAEPTPDSENPGPA